MDKEQLEERLRLERAYIEIQMIRDAIGVTPLVPDAQTYFAQMTARNNLVRKLWGVLYPKSEGQN